MARLPAGCHVGDAYDAALQIQGLELRRYDNRWCAQTLIPGVWRSAAWLGAVTLDDALDALHDRTPDAVRSGPTQLRLVE